MTELTALDREGDTATLEEGTSLWKDAWHRLLRNKAAIASGIFIIICIVLALLTPWISPYAYDAADFGNANRAPTWHHIFGTDGLGRDLFSRCLFGLRISLAIGFVAALVSFMIGVTWGATAGYFGKKIDAVMMRFVDVLYGLPYTIFVIILMTVFGRNIFLLFIALGCVQWLTMARIVRGQVISLKNKEFIEAAHSIGASNASIIFKHLIPNALGPIIVYSTLTIPNVILLEAFLSFLGLGVQAPMASLGSLVSDGASGMELYPWLTVFPGLLLAVLLFALNYLGDGLRDALDPRMKQ